jgi:hypothetical protein
MYKNRSAALQRFHKVHEIDTTPTARNVEDDYIPSAENMGLREVEAERVQLHIEMTRLQQKLAVAKRQGDWTEAAFLGNQHQAIQERQAILRQRLAQLSRENSAQAFYQAVRELVTGNLLVRVYERHREIMEQMKAGPNDAP